MNGGIVVIRNYRYTVDEELWELLEETGCQVGILTERMHVRA